MAHAEAVRARMVRRLVGPNAVTVAELGRESGIPVSTLSRWLQGAASIRVMTKKVDVLETATPTDPTAKRPQDWSALERAQLVLEAAAVDEQELGELLRRRGLHREQLDEWRASLEDALSHPRARRCRHRSARVPDPPASPVTRDPPGGSGTVLRLGRAASRRSRPRPPAMAAVEMLKCDASHHLVWRPALVRSWCSVDTPFRP